MFRFYTLFITEQLYFQTLEYLTLDEGRTFKGILIFSDTNLKLRMGYIVIVHELSNNL